MNKYITILLSFILISCSSSSQNFTPKQNDAVSINLDYNGINLITYNIQTVLGKSDEKLSGLIDYFNSQKFDFITLQEVFDESVREALISNLDTAVYKSIVPRIDYSSFPSFLFQDAGLFIASSRSKVDLTNIDFGEDINKSFGSIHYLLQKRLSPSLDFLANKSVSGTLFNINDSLKLFLFTTHLQAISSPFHRTFQLSEIYKFISNSVYTIVKNNIVNNPEHLIVLLNGDFNYNAYNQKDIETLKFYLGDPRDLHQEFNSSKMEYTMMSKLFGFRVRFDYIFAYDNIGLLPLKKVHAKSISVTDITDTTNSSISDHMAIIATLSIN